MFVKQQTNKQTVLEVILNKEIVTCLPLSKAFRGCRALVTNRKPKAICVDVKKAWESSASLEL